MVTTAVRTQTAGEILRASISVGLAGLLKAIPHFLMLVGLAFGWVYTLLLVLTGSANMNVDTLRGLDVQGLMSMGKTALLISIPFLIVGLIIACGIWGRVASVQTGREMSVGESLGLGISRWWSYFWANVIVAFAMFMGSIFLALFGGVLGVAMMLGLIFLMLVFGSVYHAAVVLEGQGPFSGLRRCFDLVLPHMGHAAGSFLLVFVVGVALSLGAEMLGGAVALQSSDGSSMPGIIHTVAEVAVSMLFIAAAIVIHSDLKVRVDPPEMDEEPELTPV